jgi:hypothetical protein
MSPTPSGPPPSDFRRRLAYYAFGVAIGLFMLGVLQAARQRSRPPAPAGVTAPASSPQPPPAR